MPSRRRAIATLLVAGVGAACRAAPDVKAGQRRTLDDIAERYVRLTLRLAQHQPSLVETWLGPEAWRPGPRGPVAEIRQEVVTLAAALAELTPQSQSRERHRYLDGQLRGLLTAARRLTGESMGFLDEARAALGVRSAGLLPSHEASADRRSLGRGGQSRDLADDSAVRAARGELERRLPGRGPLHERYAAFRLRHAFSPDRVMPTFRAAMEACRARVRQHIGLPENEGVELETVTEIGFEARAVYRGAFRTRVAIDSSGPTDIARVVWLAAHETYPGHHVQHVLADRDCVHAKGWHERALHPSFGSHLLCAEGAAEAGAALLLDGDAFEDVCRAVALTANVSTRTVADLVAVQRAVAELDVVIPAVAQAYLDGEIGREVAAERLTTNALVPNARQFLSVIERQRTRLLGYPVGRRIIGAEVLAARPENRWQRLTRIATTLNSPG